MSLKTASLWLAGVLAVVLPLRAQLDTNGLDAKEMAHVQKVYELVNSLNYRGGEIDLKDGLARLSVPKEFRYLNPEDAETVLVKLWGNPPREEKTLGLLMPAGMTPLDTNCWVVTIDYSADGFVKDDEAAKINYDDLLKTMQKRIVEENKQREELGYPAVTLVGWAAQPHYDAASHKLYWAKHLKFGSKDQGTLNYNIRVLGRRGVLELNAVAGIGQFAAIDQQTPQILSMVDFKEGNRYADFNPQTDKVAEYGLTALVAGGALAAAAKFGLFKGVWLFILAAKKFIIIGAIAVAGLVAKLLKRRA